MEAIEKAQELNPDLIVLDITMPLLNGLEAARKLREIAPHIPVVILSGTGADSSSGDPVLPGRGAEKPKVTETRS